MSDKGDPSDSAAGPALVPSKSGDGAAPAAEQGSPSMSPAMVHISKQIESSQMDSLLLTEAKAKGAAGIEHRASASIQSELDGIRAHLTSLLQQIAHAGGGHEDESHEDSSFQSSVAKMPLPLVPSLGRTDSTDSVPDFRGRKSGDLDNMLNSSYYSSGGETAREESLNLKQQVLSLQKKVEEQALKFSVTKADSSFLTEVLAQKDKILNECQVLLIELDTRYQGVVERCNVLEMTLQQKDERIRELEELAGLRKRGEDAEDDDVRGTGRRDESQGKRVEDAEEAFQLKRRNSHKKLVRWVGLDSGSLLKDDGARKARRVTPSSVAEVPGSTEPPSYSNLMDKLSELQVQLRTAR